IARIVVEGLKSSEPASSFARGKAASSPRQSATADCGGWKVLLVQSLIADTKPNHLAAYHQVGKVLMVYNLYLILYRIVEATVLGV
ncbi:hypothetical protein DYB28_014351, partial [Aphanomyces astaci]